MLSRSLKVDLYILPHFAEYSSGVSFMKNNPNLQSFTYNLNKSLRKKEMQQVIIAALVGSFYVTVLRITAIKLLGQQENIRDYITVLELTIQLSIL